MIPSHYFAIAFTFLCLHWSSASFILPHFTFPPHLSEQGEDIKVNMQKNEFEQNKIQIESSVSRLVSPPHPFSLLLEALRMSAGGQEASLSLSYFKLLQCE